MFDFLKSDTPPADWRRAEFERTKSFFAEFEKACADIQKARKAGAKAKKAKPRTLQGDNLESALSRGYTPPTQDELDKADAAIRAAKDDLKDAESRKSKSLAACKRSAKVVFECHDFAQKGWPIDEQCREFARRFAAQVRALEPMEYKPGRGYVEKGVKAYQVEQPYTRFLRLLRECEAMLTGLRLEGFPEDTTSDALWEDVATWREEHPNILPWATPEAAACAEADKRAISSDPITFKLERAPGKETSGASEETSRASEVQAHRELMAQATKGAGAF